MSKSVADRWIFVYNADAGLINGLLDWTHKILRPSTYQCQLCKLTYGNTGMNKKWRDFIAHLPMETVFLHHDEFVEQYPMMNETPLPCLLRERSHSSKALEVLMDADTMNQQKTLEQLIETCRSLFHR